MKRLWVWIGAVAVVLVLVGAGAAAWTAANVQMGVQTSNAYATTRDLPSPLLGQPAPDFTLPQAAGGKASLADYRGKTVVIDFWSSY